MTVQVDAPTATTHSHVPPLGGTQDALICIGGWAALIGYYQQAAGPVSDEAAVADGSEGDSPEVNIFARQIGIQNKLSAFRARRRLHRSYRRNQAELENAMDAGAHDPASQRELQASWTLGR